jgi:hypothetical protein
VTRLTREVESHATDRPDRRSEPKAGHWPEPGTPLGAVLYAVIAGLILWLLISVLSHIQISWH